MKDEVSVGGTRTKALAAFLLQVILISEFISSHFQSVDGWPITN